MLYLVSPFSTYEQQQKIPPPQKKPPFNFCILKSSTITHNRWMRNMYMDRSFGLVINDEWTSKLFFFFFFSMEAFFSMRDETSGIAHRPSLFLISSHLWFLWYVFFCSLSIYIIYVGKKPSSFFWWTFRPLCIYHCFMDIGVRVVYNGWDLILSEGFRKICFSFFYYYFYFFVILLAKKGFLNNIGLYFKRKGMIG